MPTDGGPMDAGPRGEDAGPRDEDAGPRGEDAGPSDAGPPAYEPCGAGSCGDTCTVCAPDDSSCVETPADELCQSDRTCAASTPACTPPTDYYYWDFEDDDGGWTTSGEIGEGCGPGWPDDPCVPGTSWEWGVPVGRTYIPGNATTRPFITTAAAGSRAWVTNLSGDYTEWEWSGLLSPTMDFSSLTEDPILDLQFICDVSLVLYEYSIDGGPWRSFLGVPASELPESDGFYAGDDVWDGRGMFDGSTGTVDRTRSAPGRWARGQIVLQGAAGSSNVRIQFGLADDVGPSPGFGLDEVRVRSGSVEPGPPVTPWDDPCRGLSCGDTCFRCAPDDPRCIEVGGPLVCRTDGRCGDDMPAPVCP